MFVLEKEKVVIWVYYLLIVMLAEVWDMLNLDLVLEHLELELMEHLELELMELQE